MIHGRTHHRSTWRPVAFLLVLLNLLVAVALPALAQGEGSAPAADGAAADSNVLQQIDFVEIARTGGVIGGVILLLSLTMVYLVFEHLLSIRRSSLIPPELPEAIHSLLAERNTAGAREHCLGHPGFLSNVLAAGLSVIEFGYADVEKAMEDTATEQAARLFRKIEYLHLIGTLAPMLGLLGTVWGMILAFMEFESKANPAVSELAPGIYRALVTTMMGLTVAVPAFFFFAIFRNRIDELVAEASLTAESVFADYRRDEARRKKAAKEKSKGGEAKSSGDSDPRIPTVALERRKPT
ncbi:MotA/TolQ/ExbB proton channel family protein [bacterium]|nr:MotA/TolQ/ExbB proton channel family protein [bacterium]